MVTASIASAQTQIADQTLTRVGGVQTVDISGNFVDTGGPLIYRATSATRTIASVIIDSTSGVLTITPAMVGTSVITVTAQDGSNTAASQMFTVTVGDSATTTTQIADQSLTIVAGGAAFFSTVPSPMPMFRTLGT